MIENHEKMHRIKFMEYEQENRDLSVFGVSHTHSFLNVLYWATIFLGITDSQLIVFDFKWVCRTVGTMQCTCQLMNQKRKISPWNIASKSTHHICSLIFFPSNSIVLILKSIPAKSFVSGWMMKSISLKNRQKNRILSCMFSSWCIPADNISIYENKEMTMTN